MFSPHRLRVEINAATGISSRFSLDGTGNPVVLLHGIARCDQASFRGRRSLKRELDAMNLLLHM